MVINNTFTHGEVVYLRTDIDQNHGIIISIKIYKGGEYMYEVVRGITTSLHYDFELSAEKNTLITV